MAAKLNAINTTTEARNELRRFQALAGGAVGQVLNTSETLTLAIRIATAHLAAEAPEVWAQMSAPADRSQ